MDNTLIRKVEDFLSNEENIIFRDGVTEDDTIASAEKALNVSFDKDYIEFLKLFGGSFAGLLFMVLKIPKCFPIKQL